MPGTPIGAVSAIITVLAILLYFWTGMVVGRMRTRHGIAAPAMTGNPEFERSVRVQMNMLEWMPIFLPLLWLATIYFSPAVSLYYLAWLPAVLGVIWIIGRYLYMTGYLAAADKRGTGFLIAALAAIGLLLCTIVGIVIQLKVTTST